MSKKIRIKRAARPVGEDADRPARGSEFVPITLDVYRVGSAPPSAPALRTVGRIREIYSAGRDPDAGVTGNVPSHVIVVAPDADVRDGAMEIGQAGDAVYVPDKDGTKFEVFAVVRREGERWCYCRRKERPGGAFTAY